MSNFILYLFEASLVLIVLYGAYQLLLSKETFFSFNRFFLIGILILSLLLPRVSFELTHSDENFINQQGTELGIARNSYHTTFDNWSEWSSNSAESATSWWQQLWSGNWSTWQIITLLTLVIYIIGFAYCILRLSLAYMKIYFLKRKLVLTNLDGLKVAKIPSEMEPFSFLDTIFIPENIENETEYSQILAHEKTHIQQRHSIDLIFVQFVAAFLWFNPMVWLLIKSLKQTHEYIADKNMLKKGFSLVEYQSLLLRQLISNNSYGLVHNFNLSFIKKRIAMMSIKESGWTGRSKAVIALSLILLVGAMSVQSNTLLGRSVLEESDAPQYNKRELKFYIDGMLLSQGLTFSKVKDYKGEFKFSLENDKVDNIHVGIDLVRKGQVVGHASNELSENRFFGIRKLLANAQSEDYLVIDIIEGPSEAVKLYNFPLFRGSKGWLKKVNSNLPPPPVTFFVNGAKVGREKAVPLSELKAEGFDVEFEYALSDFVDFDVLSKQAGGIEIILARKRQAVKVLKIKEVKRKTTLDLEDIWLAAKTGDRVVIQFGKSGGIVFQSVLEVE